MVTVTMLTMLIMPTMLIILTMMTMSFGPLSAPEPVKQQKSTTNAILKNIQSKICLKNELEKIMKWSHLRKVPFNFLNTLGKNHFYM